MPYLKIKGDAAMVKGKNIGSCLGDLFSVNWMEDRGDGHIDHIMDSDVCAMCAMCAVWDSGAMFYLFIDVDRLHTLEIWKVEREEWMDARERLEEA